MTATPFTDSPMELFKLVNLCKEDPKEKITINPVEFKAQYMDNDNILTESGIKKLADNLSGYISYLNREQDPTQFAQPIMIEVPSIMSYIREKDLRDELLNENLSSDNKKAKKNALSDEKAIRKEKMVKMKGLKTSLIDQKKEYTRKLKERQLRCKTIKKRDEKAKCMKQIKEETDAEYKEKTDRIKADIEQLKKDIDENKPGTGRRSKNLKERIEELKNSLNQEAMLIDRCKSIKHI